MKEYTSDKLRNVAIVAHGGAGKTSVSEALLFNSGAVNRLGRVDDGTAVTDYEPEEVKRKVSIISSLAPCEWKENKINFIDTPGFADFVAEVKSGLRAAECAMVVLCAASGVEVVTEKVWQYAADLNLPRIAFINKMDRENANFDNVVNQMKENFGNNILPFQLPIGAESSFQGVIDLVSMKAYVQNGGKTIASAIPDELLDKANIMRLEMLDAAAEADDDLLVKYLEGDELTDAEIQTGLIKGIAQGQIFPVFCGSAYKNIGMDLLLDNIINYVPSPAEVEMAAVNKMTKEDIVSKVDDPFSAFVFKTTADPFVGRLSYFRVVSGLLKGDNTIYNVSKDKSERIGNIFTLRGKQQIPMTIVHAGDIAVVAKLQDTVTGDSIGEKDGVVIYPNIDIPKPMFTMCIEAKNKGDEDKIGNALNRIVDEDLTFKLEKNLETKQLLVSGMGELHIDIMAEKIKRKFGVEVTLQPPKIAYRETIRSSVKVEGKHKKQSGGHGQYGHVWLQLDPLPTGGEFEFVDSIFGGAVPRQYIPAVEKGVREALTNGILAGYPMVDVKVTLTDGSYHTVDSSEMAFKIASTMALKKGVLQAKPVLLEPVFNIEVTVPEKQMGDIIGDFNSKRGRIQGMEPSGRGLGIVKAQVPYAELLKYALELRSLTQGRGNFTVDFSHYDEVPQRIAEGIIASTVKKDDND